MASKRAFAIFTILLALQLSTSQAKEFIVGDDAGWTTNFDYQAWAKDKVFHVGDTLVFKYRPGAHNVRGVNAADFQNCAAPADSKLFDSGHDVITLPGAGEKWYICGVSSHCAEGGQKLTIKVEMPDASHIGEGGADPSGKARWHKLGQWDCRVGKPSSICCDYCHPSDGHAHSIELVIYIDEFVFSPLLL